MERQQQIKSGLLVIQLKSGQFFDSANPIQQCGPVNTTISLLSSSSSDSYLASSVKSEDDNQIFGIISRYDNKKKLLEMTQLNSSSNVKVGTEVVTSGLDDVSVKDVPIGTVDSVSDYEGNRTILVKPYADFDKISYVTLVGDGK